jgi:phage tail-like protein
MDANGLKFWMLAAQADWSLDSDAVQFEKTNRALRLARQGSAADFPANEAEAVKRLDLVPGTIDRFGTSAFWSPVDGAVMAAGAVPGNVRLFVPPAGAVTDVALGYDDLLYIAVAGAIAIADPRQRFDPAVVPALPGFAAWRLAAHPDGGVWALDKDHNKLARVFGSPSTMRPHPPYDANTVRPCVENSDPPRLVLLDRATWPADERPVAIASNAQGEAAILYWKSGELARVRRMGANGMPAAPQLLAGASTPFTFTYTSATQIALLLPNVQEAPVYSLADPGAPIPSDGDVYPLKNHDGGPFLHTTVAPAYYPSSDGPRGLYRLSLPSYARSGTARNKLTLDSGNQATVWHRLYLEADIPDHCGIQVYLAAVNDPAATPAKDDWYPHRFGRIFPTDGVTPRGAWVRTPSEIPFHPGLLACAPEEGRSGLFTALIQRGGARGRRVRSLRGRYLKVRVELTGNGLSTPELAAVRAYSSRFSYIDKYLPQLYREDVFGPETEDVTASTPADFLERFTDNFEGVLTPLEDRIADSYLLTNADVVPADSLEWLGNWIGLGFDSAYTDTQRRRLLKATPELYKRRGTVQGLGLALDIATNGAVSRGQIVVLEDFRLRRTFATILGADLDDANDPLLAGTAHSGNSFVGDTLFLGDPKHLEFLALFGANLPKSKSEARAVENFFDQLANRVTILVHQEMNPQDLGLVRRVAALETPAHVAVRVEQASNEFRAGVASLVGADTYLAPKPQPRTARVDVSYFGRGDVIDRLPALDPRLGGEDGVARGPIAQLQAPPEVELGAPIPLSAADSKAFGGRKIGTYLWTLLD